MWPDIFSIRRLDSSPPELLPLAGRAESAIIASETCIYSDAWSICSEEIKVQ